MTTITFNNVTTGVTAPKATAKSRSLFARFIDAVIESRQRQAEIEARRVMALIGEPKLKSADYAMLPFQGE
jgi:hypothetical protein